MARTLHAWAINPSGMILELISKCFAARKANLYGYRSIAIKPAIYEAGLQSLYLQSGQLRQIV